MTGLQIVQPTQHWRTFADNRGVWYRDCWVRTRSGVLELLAVRDDLVAAA
jgi:hypothetical protein